MPETIKYEGKIIRIVGKVSPSGKELETAIRPPGTRILIHDVEQDRILLTHEIRLDIGDDFRLPGGKVRNTNSDWDLIKDSPRLDSEIITAGSKESREECGYELLNPKVFTVATSGGPTIKWDLYYIVATEFTNLGHQELEADEEITMQWYSIPEVIDLCLSGKIQEGRSVAAILQYLRSISKI